jgi:hypothetical protein
VQPGLGLIPGYSGVLLDRFDPATAVGDCSKRVLRVQTGLNEGFKFSEGLNSQKKGPSIPLKEKDKFQVIDYYGCAQDYLDMVPSWRPRAPWNLYSLTLVPRIYLDVLPRSNLFLDSYICTR